MSRERLPLERKVELGNNKSDQAHFEQNHLWGRDRHRDPGEISRIEETVALLPGGIATVVELGAGDGVVSHAVKEKRPEVQVIAVERSRAALDCIRLSRVQADMTALPFRDRSFDLVMACEVLEHLPEEDFRQALREVNRIANRYVLVTVPNREKLSRHQVHCPRCGCDFHEFRHLRSFAPADLQACFPGLELCRLQPIGRPARVQRDWIRLLKRYVLGTNYSPWAMCPQCGYTQRGRGESGQGQPGDASSGLAPASRWSFLFYNFLTTHRRQPWLAGLFRKTDSTC